ncbi:MAG: RagB/SusD family nutrient uptake outer membrane protein [Clostridium sp.]|nr:RagB/SusD family nutrient uptake outer membrane protein [Clostridium sp.]
MKRTYNIFRMLVLSCLVGGAAVSCDDMLDMESGYVITDPNHLNSAADTVNTVLGILNKLQAIADRTNLLGEVRGDLVTLTDYASKDLHQMAEFAMDDENSYNNPRDYYAVINNCNYFLAYADTSLTDNRNNKVFEREYAAVKSIRAWTYLQLVLNYGRVPFVVEPILDETAALRDYPYYELPQICDYFIADLEPYKAVDLPDYQYVDGRYDPHKCFFPIPVVLGDLYLWRGATGGVEDYKQAALSYYDWIVTERSYKDILVTNTYKAQWDAERLKNNQYATVSSYGGYFFSGENVSGIPMDSAANMGYFSQLRMLYNSMEDNSYNYSVGVSQRMKDISREQVYCGTYSDGRNIVVVYPNLPDDMDRFAGDLRLWSVYSYGQASMQTGITDMQMISKHSGRDVNVYRRSTIYLRMAEALNQAGYPRFAYAFLSTGVNNDTIARRVLPYCSKADSTFVEQFNFRTDQFVIEGSSPNTLGIHSRGCGETVYNKHYVYPAYPVALPEEHTEADSLEWVAKAREYEMDQVDNLLITEDALELCFEGTRFYDLMRVALRRNDPSYLAKAVSRRAGAEKPDAKLEGLLSDKRNWYMKWNNEVGY